ncbi:hypothetical protein [Leifsonia sp. TF02-11]|uniref:hypothetical protein n=1 Tax=Leifsonia sp. TF02-11 TaxID=2815212 RepID=UPI001AA0B8B0|nr:hypothetical protein [Leifsonia sp. TF02-11]MBN9631433.1 hypothetical protein [Actinomycetota bacterium]MBO1739721.1 hypothetical protein [Leifsonia sp. TF02-11]
MEIVLAVLERGDIAYEIEFERTSEPPFELRVPSHIGGAAVVDVFDLVDSSEWPVLLRYAFAECVPAVIGSPDDLNADELGDADF